jgi:hypothetical protein
MKKIALITTLVVLTLSLEGFAQVKKDKIKNTPEENAHTLTNQMTEVMGLSTDAKTKVYNINLKAAQALKIVKDEIKAEYPDKEVRKTNKEAIKTKYSPKLKSIRAKRKEALKTCGISEEQWTKWKTYKKAKKAEKIKEKDLEEDADDLEGND